MIDFTNINQMLDAAMRLDADVAWKTIVDGRVVKSEIIRLNTQEQLFELGVDALGRSLGPYRPLTIEYKIQKGQRYDHVTLRDSGEFYSSWNVVVTNDGIEIDANDIKDDKALFEVYGEDILGLTEDSRDTLVEMLINEYRNYVWEKLFH